jgi:hypothetical protein
MSIKTKLPVQASLFLRTNTTLKDCKAEILLTFVLQLFHEYELLKNKQHNQNKNIITVLKASSTDDLTIDTVITELSTYLKENVIQKEKLFRIFREANLNQQNFLLAKQYEPYGVYFEKLGKLLKNNVPIGTMFMPEYLGLLLIHLYKLEALQSFCKFPFVDTLELEEIMNIYGEVNIKVKKELVEKFPETKIWEHRTIFDTMEKIATKIIKEYNQFQYKLNVNRVSKTRKKR